MDSIGKKFSIDEAVKIISDEASKKFVEAIDVAVNLGIDPKKSDQVVRGATTLPNGSGKAIRVCVFAQEDSAEDAKKAGAELVGMDDLSAEISKGRSDFDVVIATPETMRVVSPLGQILGPKGLMPNPKAETVTKDIPNAVKNSKAGQIRYKSDKQGIIHSRIGQVGYTEKQLEENLVTFLADVKKAKPPSAKGVYISKVSISSTMGKGLELDLSALSF